MEPDALTLYKLMILFILDKVDFPMTNAQMSNFILEKEYTNYFNIQQAISELILAELINTETIRNCSYYRINSSGQETLEFFNDTISEIIKHEILDYLKEHKYELREEVSTLADYYKEKKHEFLVRCRVKEKESIVIDLTLNVATEEEANMICNNWPKKNQEIYKYLLETLMHK